MEDTKRSERLRTAYVIALFALTLVSIFFVISTMARYTTGGTGTGTVGVAEWDVKFGDGTAKLDFGKLSPNKNEMDAINPQALTNSHSGTISITNSGDVDAIVTVDLTINNPRFTFAKGAFDTTSTTDVYTNDSGITDTKSAPRQSEVERLFSFKVKPETLKGVDNTEDNIVVMGDKYCYIRVPAATTAEGTITPTVVTIGVDLIWTTDYVKLGEVADHLDTWVGENISKIEWDINFNAVQGSELPSGDKADLPVSPYIDAAGMDASTLQAAVAKKVSKGATEIIIINMPEEPSSDMLRAISDGLSDAKDGSIDLTIENVTKIYSGSFTNCSLKLNSITLPEVKEIPQDVFNFCTNLKTVNLPKAEIIDKQAFLRCWSLTEINLPKATTIGDYAFGGCTKLTTVILPVATTIGSDGVNGVFQDCTALKEINLPAATTIAGNAFGGCTSLTTVILPAATTIGSDALAVFGAFQSCTKLTTLKLTAEGDITFNKVVFNGVATTNITLYLNANKSGSIKNGNTFNDIQFGAIEFETPTAA